MLIQDYLKTNSFYNLAKDHGIYASFSKSGYKFSLNYDQFESKESDLMAQECRGLILSFENGQCPISCPENSTRKDFDHIIPGKTEIIAFPMKRFFNYGQEEASNIDWTDTNLSILEKLDGSLNILYYDKYTSWHVATRSNPEADQIIIESMTFRNLFEKALENIGLSFNKWTDSLNKNITYCFELTSPYNRVVVSYLETKITLIAARDIKTLKEININSLNIPVVKSYKYSCLQDLINWVIERDPLCHEGVVVLDSNFNRLKLKSPSYVLAHHTIGSVSVSERAIMNLILLEKDDDMASFFSEEIKNKISLNKKRLIELIKCHDDLFIELKSKCEDKKSFALFLKDLPGIWTAPLFYMFDGKAKNMKDYLDKNKIDGRFKDSFVDKLIELCQK